MSVFIYLVPIYYLNNGMNEIQVSLLTAMLSFGAIFQPVFALLIDNKKRLKTIYNLLAIGLVITMILISKVSSFSLLIILFFIYSLNAQTTSSLSDNVITNYALTNGENYGNYKKFSTIGWGLGVAICLPIIYILPAQYMFVFLAAVTLVALICINSSSGFDVYYPEQFRISDVKKVLENKFILLFIIFTATYNGVLTVKSYYLSTLLANASDSNLLITIMPLVLMVPEIVVLLLYPSISKRFNFKQIYLICNILLISLLMFCAIVNNPIILLAVMSIHGIISGLFLPTLLITVHKRIEVKFQIATFMIITSSTFLVSALISSVLIAPLLNYFSLNIIFLILAVLTTFCFLPLSKMTQYVD